jgi:hypothetical protein
MISADLDGNEGGGRVPDFGTAGLWCGTPAKGVFMRQLCLTPLLGIIKRGVFGCRVELKPVEKGQEAVDKLKGVENLQAVLLA